MSYRFFFFFLRRNFSPAVRTVWIAFQPRSQTVCMELMGTWQLHYRFSLSVLELLQAHRTFILFWWFPVQFQPFQLLWSTFLQRRHFSLRTHLNCRPLLWISHPLLASHISTQNQISISISIKSLPTIMIKKLHSSLESCQANTFRFGYTISSKPSLTH